MSLNRFDLLSDARNNQSTPRLLYISAAKYDQDWLSVPHTHSCAELFYILGGQGTFLIGKETFQVAKGDLVIINPQVEHTETGSHAYPLEYVVLGVDGLELSLGGDSNRQFCLTRFIDTSPQVQIYLQDILQETSTRAPGYEVICQNLLDILVVLLMRSSDYSARMLPSAGHANKDSATVRRYIDAHFKEPLTLDFLAGLVHINKYHMAHNFTRDYGVSPINYLLRLRLQESCSLLRSTNHSMTQIARIVGFSSPSYFSQIFRKTMGLSPSDYRAKQRE